MDEPGSRLVPDWDVPTPYGYAAAIENMGSVAAPFLAGLGIALATLVMSSPDSFAHPNLALFLLVATTLTLLGTLQCAFWARCYLVTPGELADWWAGALEEPRRLEKVEGEQRRAKRRHETWATRASLLYELGLSCLLLAVPVLLIPPGGFAHVSKMRLAAFALAALGGVVELVWIAQSQKGYVSRVRKQLGL
jgi:hypothetical protein